MASRRWNGSRSLRSITERFAVGDPRHLRAMHGAGVAFDVVFNDRESGPLRALIGMSNLFLMSALGIILRSE